MWYRRCRLAMIAALIVGSASTVSAHRITVFAHVHGAEVHGQVTDEGELPVANATVRSSV